MLIAPRDLGACLPGKILSIVCVDDTISIHLCKLHYLYLPIPLGLCASLVFLSLLNVSHSFISLNFLVFARKTHTHTHLSNTCMLYVWSCLLYACACLVAQSCLTLCDHMDCSPPGFSVHGDSPGKNTGEGSLSLLHGIFPIQGSNPGLPHCRQILNHLSH